MNVKNVIRGQFLVAVESASGGVLCNVAKGGSKGRVGLPKLIKSSSNCRRDPMAPCNQRGYFHLLEFFGSGWCEYLHEIVVVSPGDGDK